MIEEHDKELKPNGGAPFSISGITGEQTAQEKPASGCHGLDGVAADAKEDAEKSENQGGKYAFRTQPSEPAGTAPLIISRTTWEIVQKKTLNATQEAELKRMLGENIGLYYNPDKRELATRLNAYPWRAFLGIICEFSRQSESIQKYFNHVKEIGDANKKRGAVQRTVPEITHTRQGGFPVLGYPKEKLTQEEQQFLQQLHIAPHEPVCFIYPAQFAKDYFGLEIDGKQYANFVSYILDVSNQRFAWEHGGKLYTTPLFTASTQTGNGKTCVLVTLNAPSFYETMRTEFLKLSQRTFTIQQRTTGLFEMRLYLFIVDEWKRLHRFAKRRQQSISRPYSIDKLIAMCATQEELNQRKPKQLRKRFYNYLQTLVDEGVLISFSHEEFNTDGFVGIEIAANPFLISQI